MDSINNYLASWRNPLIARELVVGILATLVAFFSALLVPMLGIFVGIFTPLPTLLNYYRWGAPVGYTIPGVAFALGCLVLFHLNTLQSAPYFLELLGLGVFLGVMIRRNWSLEKTIGWASLTFFVLGISIYLLLHGSILGEDLFQHLQKVFQEAVTVTFQQYGGTSPEARMLEQSLHNAIPLMVRLLPGAALASTIVLSWINVLILKRYCQVHRVPLPAWGEWRQWRTPEFLVWFVIVSGFSLLLPVHMVKFVALNALIVLSTIYLLQGLAVIAFYFDKWKVPRLLRAFLYVLLVMQQFASLLAVCIGFFDVWIDFRRLTKKPT